MISQSGLGSFLAPDEKYFVLTALGGVEKGMFYNMCRRRTYAKFISNNFNIVFLFNTKRAILTCISGDNQKHVYFQANILLHSPA